MGGRGTAAVRNSGSTADFSQGYKAVGVQLREKYRTIQDLRNDGFVPLNDWSLSSLLKESNEIASDNQPWNNRVVYFVWDPDFKNWQKVAERRY